jgi:hypothetical protein
MENIKDIGKKALVATAKGAVSLLPGGSFLSEYFNLATEHIASKRQQEWQEMIEEKLSKLEDDMSEIASNELFFSCVQTATVGALKSYQKEKCKLFANALYNSYILTDMENEKKLIFMSLLDKYTLLAIKVLNCYSEDNYQKYDDKVQKEANPNPRNMVRTTVHHGQERPIDYLIDEIPEIKKERELAKTIVSQLHADGLIEPVDFDMPVYPDTNRRKRSTKLGDEFLEFIYDN